MCPLSAKESRIDSAATVADIVAIAVHNSSYCCDH